ncbi:chromosome partitioning protein ParA [Oceanidesulfovibrio indonesiensis]|uniref:Chromosome partitioning protein ParA n=1 Tax=Oceanidesulfovibrio indonesiensis TaxID=54767 RepID=A0A7M3MJ69_9BACT|nr:AAA family ATPase [Oceanidesulfovibrio indonesiensis]TVM19730.1 chromosome partitioning protein ParA [Oceanidesulfovibrio indonesiensis]
MEIICPNCGFQRTIDDSKVPPRKAMVHCKSCGHRFPLKKARSIAVLLSKGGVGKTTTSVNLAAGLALEGKRVLLVDTDTQGQSAYMLGVKPKAGLTELVTRELKPKDAMFKARDNLWLLSGGKSLAGIKRMIDRKDFGGEMTLTEALAPLEVHFDFIVIDSSPGWDPLTVNVLFYAKEVLIPVSLEVMSLQGLSEFIKSLQSIKKYRKEVGIKYILPTFLDERIKNPGEILEKLKTIYSQYLCPPVRYNVRLSEAPAYGMTIFEYAGGSTGAADYKALVKKVLSEDEEEGEEAV